MAEDYVRLELDAEDEQAIRDLHRGEDVALEGSINGAPVEVRIRLSESEDDDEAWVLFVDGPTFHEPAISLHASKLNALQTLDKNYADDADVEYDVLVKYVRQQGLTVWLVPQSWPRTDDE